MSARYRNRLDPRRIAEFVERDVEIEQFPDTWELLGDDAELGDDARVEQVERPAPAEQSDELVEDEQPDELVEDEQPDEDADEAPAPPARRRTTRK